jgi:hypothetical protein
VKSNNLFSPACISIAFLGISISGFFIGSYVKISATPLDDHAYAQQAFIGDNYGGNVTLALGQEDLISSSSSTNKIGSINKEMWVILDKFNSCWIEAGQKKGEQIKDMSQPDDSSAQSINWNGHFIGASLFNKTSQRWEFHGTPYGTGSPTGQHTYQIKLTNPSTGEWKVYINGIQALTLANSYCRDYLTPNSFLTTKSFTIKAGIESKDSSNSFKNGTYIYGWQFLNIADGKWKLVTAAQNDDASIYNGMKSTFNYVASPSPSNSITFNHN